MKTLLALFILSCGVLMGANMTVTVDHDSHLLTSPLDFFEKNAPGLTGKAPSKYAIFFLTMYYPGDTAKYYDFELKASVTNFNLGTAGGGKVFWYHSPDPNNLDVPNQIYDIKPRVYFAHVASVKESCDGRALQEQAGLSIYGQLSSGDREKMGVATVVVVVESNADWFSPDNEKLQWSFCRMRASGHEAYDAEEQFWVWRHIRPIWSDTSFKPF